MCVYDEELHNKLSLTLC